MNRTRTMPAHRVPSYRLHKATGQAVVVIRGVSVYLGKYGTPASKARYDEHVAAYLAARRTTDHTRTPEPPTPHATADLTVSELVLRYWTFAKAYYVKNGVPSGEQPPLKAALRVLRRQAGDTPAAAFGPLALKAVRDALVTRPIVRRVKVTDPDTAATRLVDKVVRVGLSRRTINKQIGRIKRAFAWAVAEELVPAHVHEALRRVDGLRRGRSGARESARITPVPDADIEAVASHVRPTIAAMIRVQRLSGCRPQEIVRMRGTEIDTTAAVWEYRPGRHKTEHRTDGGGADRDRVVFLGPRAQAVLGPYLTAAGGGFVFGPRRGRPRAGSPAAAGPRRDAYSVAANRQEVRRGCRRAGVPVWCPLQLRHTSATEIRKRFGVERAQAVLGHAEIGVTQVYAEVDRDAARAVMAELG